MRRERWFYHVQSQRTLSQIKKKEKGSEYRGVLLCRGDSRNRWISLEVRNQCRNSREPKYQGTREKFYRISEVDFGVVKSERFVSIDETLENFRYRVRVDEPMFIYVDE